LVTFVKDEYKRAHVLPLGHQIFHIFNSCPFEKVKVVILGQDPYPNPGQYYGVCFSVPEGVAIPGSLNNIFKEIHQDLGKPIPASGNLDRWVAQGVFPLNSVLTVRAHETGSHRNMGWEIFTDAVIRKLSEDTWLVDMGRVQTGWFEMRMPTLPEGHIYALGKLCERETIFDRY
jgi:uracil-DNA glycosylase